MSGGAAGATFNVTGSKNEKFDRLPIESSDEYKFKNGAIYTG